MKTAAIIIGIDEWEKYTLPLIASIQQHEPGCDIVAIDNDSATPYPDVPGVTMVRTVRLNFCAAVNVAQQYAPDAAWYIVLENDCLCTGPFNDLLRETPTAKLYGPMMSSIDSISHMGGWQYVDGWCVVMSSFMWHHLGQWDEQYVVSSWGDVDYSRAAWAAGYGCDVLPIPFTHFWQHQRHRLPEFTGTHEANMVRFKAKWGL